MIRSLNVHDKAIQSWLWIGVGMIVIQIMVGGITRLTGSGLSITKWEIVTGTLPPLSTEAWEREFDLYKATPQYAKINQGMTMDAFKFIYFWEYIHRLWARLIGLVFLFPFLFFWLRKRIDRQLMKYLLGAVSLGGIVGLFGWIMVASGLINRPWVNAYKLMFHLGLAVILFGYMVYVSVRYQLRHARLSDIRRRVPAAAMRSMVILVFVQILFGALMSGMKAGLFYPTWPTLNGEWIPALLFNGNYWNVSTFKNYDDSLFVPALVQFIHRGLAYFIFVVFALITWRYRNDQSVWIGFILLIAQVLLGIWTLINCVGSIPLTLGVAHQVVGILFFGWLIAIWTIASRGKTYTS